MKENMLDFYNNFIKLTRNKDLYKNFSTNDDFSDRLKFLLIHLAFFFKSFKENKNSKQLQEIYDFTFKQLELSIREIGYGDQSINKKMKDYLNLFHALLDKIHFWDNLTEIEKIDIIDDLIDKSTENEFLVKYFDNFKLNLSKYNLNSFLKSVIKL
jgi:cytochrome b pre-mRNA-processing protein 3